MKKHFLFALFALVGLYAHAATITTDKLTYTSGESIVISWTGARDALDWIGIYKEGQKPGTSTPAMDWDYVTGASGSLVFPGRKTGLASLPAGRYVAILLCCDGYRVKSTSVTFEVTSTAPAPTLTVNKSSYTSGEAISFTYSGGTGSPTDWIGIFFAGEIPSGNVTPITWKYVPNSHGTIDFSNTLTGGPFVAHLFCCDGYSSLAVSGQFTVAPGTGICNFTQTPTIPDVITRIGFGSCASQDLPQPSLDVAVSKDPDLFIYLGDNMYANTYDPARLKQFYQAIYGRPEFCNLKNSVPIIATWDDHDYGMNDDDKDNPNKVQSQQIFCDFWGEPANSVRRSRPGIYTSYVYGTQPGKKVQVILLDLRYFLDDKRPNNGCGKNEYCPTTKQSATMMGDAQWLWLDAQLRVPADLRIIASSVSFGAEYNGFEGWSLFPQQRDKMANLIKSTGANGVVFISGDLHYSELSAYTGTAVAGLYPLYDFTSSGINREWRPIEPNQYRVPGVDPTSDQSTGQFVIDWANQTLTMTAWGAENNVLFTHTISLNSLRLGTSAAAAASEAKAGEEKLIVYPNPSSAEVIFKIDGREAGLLKVVDTHSGRVVTELHIEKNENVHKIEKLPAGAYSVVLYAESGSVIASKKLIVEK